MEFCSFTYKENLHCVPSVKKCRNNSPGLSFSLFAFPLLLAARQLSSHPGLQPSLHLWLSLCLACRTFLCPAISFFYNVSKASFFFFGSHHQDSNLLSFIFFYFCSNYCNLPHSCLHSFLLPSQLLACYEVHISIGTSNPEEREWLNFKMNILKSGSYHLLKGQTIINDFEKYIPWNL